jgi:mRNA interferase MazF
VSGAIRQCDIVWVDYGDPMGSETGFRRPAIVIQSDEFNLSRIGTVICIPLTSNLRIAEVPGNLYLKSSETGLDQDSVANVAQIGALDRSRIGEWVGSISDRQLQTLFRGVDLVLGR